MPIIRISTTPEPGYLIHGCAACGAQHRLSFNRGAQKTRTGPFHLQIGDTLTVQVDSAEPVTLTLAAADFSDFARVTAAQLATKLSAAVPGIEASDDAGGVLIESASSGEGSRVQIVDGTARAALGFSTDARVDALHSRLVLGISVGAGQIVDKNVMPLRRCNDCGANECLVRTFAAGAPELDGTHLQEHRRAVNSLAEHCKDRGWSHPDVIDQHAAEATRPADLHPSFHHEPVDLSRFHPREDWR